jgi:trans-aconitate methyltransferase
MDEYSLGILRELHDPGPALVDLGCGAGGVAEGFAASDPEAQVVAVDADTSIVTPAVRAAPNITVIQADVRTWAPGNLTWCTPDFCLAT